MCMESGMAEKRNYTGSPEWAMPGFWPWRRFPSPSAGAGICAILVPRLQSAVDVFDKHVGKQWGVGIFSGIN